MRFAITATDRTRGIFDAFLEAGWEPLKLFTEPVDDVIDHHRSVVERAQQSGIPIQLSRLREEDLIDLHQRDCEVLIVAGYGWRIGDWRPYLNHAVNFHPSPLPVGRGPYPAIRAILENCGSWGVACHQLSAEFDAGDLLASEHFPLGPDECHDSLDLKIQLASKRLAERVAADFPALWLQAQPQGPGSYWPRCGNQERMLDFSCPVAHLLRQIRAFGNLECLATINDVPIHVRQAVGWTEAHSHVPGSVVHSNPHARKLVVAAQDGYIGIIKWSFTGLDAVRQIGR